MNKRWDIDRMLDIGRKLFATIHKQKRHANPNHDVHFLARELDSWLLSGIQSFYQSISHSLLIDDIKKHYQDSKIQEMLENIIRNPIETPRGYKNPDQGIALRGSLSQFFSGLFLKPLDDAFNTMQLTYLRYQDDILILCQTKRQLTRAVLRLKQVLHERRLR